MTAPTRRGGSGRLVVLVAVLAAVLLVYLTTRATPTPAFSVESTAPDGYRALALLVEGRGGTMHHAQVGELRAGDAVVVPRPSRLGPEERRALEDHAAAGANVVLGDRFAEGEPDPFDFEVEISHRQLADTEALAVPTGVCTIDRLAGLGPVDAAFSPPVPVLEGESSCYGTEVDALVTSRPVGDGEVVTLADPLLWVNARLQPAKESGGDPLDNAAMALGVLGADAGTDVAVVLEGAAAPGTDGGRDPLDLLPLPVKLALVQAAVALVLYLWWRGRRLGRPVQEPLPVEIAASELVVAVGDLLRRRGSAPRAAAAMRDGARRALCSRLGIPVDAPPGVVAERVAARSSRSPQEVAAILYGPEVPGGAAVPDTGALQRLADQLDSIRQEALDDRPVR